MAYEAALSKAWDELENIAHEKLFSVKLLSDTYDIDITQKAVNSISCNIPAKEHIALLLLHYAAKKAQLKELPAPTGQWINFSQLESGEVYYTAFKKRTIDRIVKKYGSAPDAISDASQRFGGAKIDYGDVGVVVYPFEKIPILITIWKADEEFGPDANILFDKNISQIFCMEDIVVLTEILVHQL